MLFPSPVASQCLSSRQSSDRIEMEVGGWVEYMQEEEMFVVRDCQCFILSAAQIHIIS